MANSEWQIIAMHWRRPQV